MRNVVLITLDSLRADHCGFLGYSRDTTPTMDKMTREGLYFGVHPKGIHVIRNILRKLYKREGIREKESAFYLKTTVVLKPLVLILNLIDDILANRSEFPILFKFLNEATLVACLKKA